MLTNAYKNDDIRWRGVLSSWVYSARNVPFMSAALTARSVAIRRCATTFSHSVSFLLGAEGRDSTQAIERMVQKTIVTCPSSRPYSQQRGVIIDSTQAIERLVPKTMVTCPCFQVARIFSSSVSHNRDPCKCLVDSVCSPSREKGEKA